MKESLLWRILGNDVPDRHSANQTYRCLEHILVNEDVLPHCQKRFLVNRIACDDKRGKILDLLMSFGEDFTEIPFDPEAYDRLPHEQRAGYLTNQAYAKNFCIDWGLENDFDFVLPFDGQIFIPSTGWGTLQRKVDSDYGTLSSGHQEFLAMLMVRAKSFVEETFDEIDSDGNIIGCLSHESWVDHTGMSRYGVSSPQIIFSEESDVRYRDLPYGDTSVDMLNRIGLAGLWSKLDPDKFRESLANKSSSYGQVFAAGYCVRLPSGKPDIDVDGWKRHFARQAGIQKLVLQVNSLVEES